MEALDLVSRREYRIRRPHFVCSALGSGYQRYLAEVVFPELTSRARTPAFSIGRAFEYEFMYEKLLPEYLSFMRDSWQHGGSLLSQITDVLRSRDTSIGVLLKMTLRHYMVMVDIIGSKEKKARGRKWDLKPPEFFEV